VWYSSNFFLTYFGLGASFWWTLVPLHLLLSVQFMKFKQSLKRTEIYFQLVGWGFPLVFLVIGIGMGEMGNYQGATLCLMQDTDNFKFQYALFYVPITVSLALGFFFFIITLGILIDAERKSNKKISIYKYRTVLAFCWMGISIFTVVVANRFYNSVIVDETEAGVEDWLYCYVSAFTVNADAVATCGEVPAFRPLTGFDNFFLFVLGSCGVIAALLYSTEARFLMWLHRIYVKVKLGDFQWTDLRDPADLMSTGKSSLEMDSAHRTGAETNNINNSIHSHSPVTDTSSYVDNTSEVLGTSSNYSYLSNTSAPFR